MNIQFMKQALELSLKSKDPNTKVGCVITDGVEIIGEGFNRMPMKAIVQFPWGKSGEVYETKYPYVIHAEMSAIKNAIVFRNNSNMKELYVTLFPCSNCAKLLIEMGIQKVYYLSDKYAGLPDIIASKKLLEGCKIECIQITEEDLC